MAFLLFCATAQGEGTLQKADLMTSSSQANPSNVTQDEEEAQKGAILRTEELLNENAPIRHLKVRGLKRIGESVVRGHFPKRLNNIYSQLDLDAFLKSLLDTQLFKEVVLSREGDALTVHVKENKIINEIRFEGNRNIKEEDLKKIITLKERGPLHLTALEESAQKIKQLYKERGLYSTQITPQHIELADGRANLIFSIQEGSKAYIRRLVFSGNKFYGKTALANAISSKEERWYRFFSPPEELYNPERAKFDEEKLRQFYTERGFLDVQVKPFHGELITGTSEFVLTFSLEEGPRYTFGEVKFKNLIKAVNVALLEPLVTWKKTSLFSFSFEKWFRTQEVRRVCEAMEEKLRENGITFAEVIPETKKRPGKNGGPPQIDVTFVIQPAAPQYVHSINLKGNYGTNRNVILRELDFAPGTPLTSSKITNSENALNALGFFERVEISDSPAPGAPEDQRLVHVELKEKSTGKVGAAISYSFTDGAGGRLGYDESNFLGSGRALSTTFTGNQRGVDLNVGTRVPYFLGRHMTAGVDTFFSTYRGDTQGNFDKKGGYNQRTVGTGFSLEYAITQRIFQEWSYKIQHESLNLRHKNSSKRPLTPEEQYFRNRELSPYLDQSIGAGKKDWLSSLGHFLTYSALERKGGEAVSGWVLRGGFEWCGLGGTVKYLSGLAHFSHYLSFDEDGKFMLRTDVRYSALKSLGRLRFVDQYFLGGFAFPGFLQSGVGPRDGRSNDALGGRNMYTASTKFYFPLGFSSELPVKGVAYIQSGALWNSMFKGKYVSDEHPRHRVTTGAGFVVKVPMLGHLGLVFTKALLKYKGDEREPLMVILGQDF